MNIKEAIQQKRPFRNNYQQVLVNLLYTHNWVTDQLRQYLKPYGVTMKQYNVLRILKGAVDRLHQRGLVVRSTCATDKRLVDVTLSAEGEALLQNMKDIEQEMDAIFEHLDEKDSALLSELLDKLRG